MQLALADSFGPKGIAERLSSDRRSRLDDPEYVQLRRRVCPAQSSAWQDAVVSVDRDANVFELCQLQRFELLSETETFAFEDLDAFVLYQWLMERDVEEGIRRQVASALLSTHLSESELVAECRDKGRRCALALRQRNVDLPSSHELLPDASFEGMTQLWLTRDAVLVDDRRVSAEPTSGEPLAARAALEDTPERVMIFADASLPFGLVADRWLDAIANGAREFELAAVEPAGLKALSVTPARAWFEPSARELIAEQLPAGPVISLEMNQLEVWVGAKLVHTMSLRCTEPSCIDFDRLARELDAVKQGAARAVQLRVSREVDYGTAFSVLSWAWRRTCSSPAAVWGEVCERWTVDTDPPQYWHRAASVSLADASIEPEPREDSKPSPMPGLLNVYADERERLEACLLADQAFWAAAGPAETLRLIWSFQSERAALRLGTKDEVWASPELQGCFCEVLGVEPAAGRLRAQFMTEDSISLVMPVRFDQPTPQ